MKDDEIELSEARDEIADLQERLGTSLKSFSGLSTQYYASLNQWIETSERLASLAGWERNTDKRNPIVYLEQWIKERNQ